MSKYTVVGTRSHPADAVDLALRLYLDEFADEEGTYNKQTFVDYVVAQLELSQDGPSMVRFYSERADSIASHMGLATQAAVERAHERARNAFRNWDEKEIARELEPFKPPGPMPIEMILPEPGLDVEITDRGEPPEIESMKAIVAALQSLGDNAARERVLAASCILVGLIPPRPHVETGPQ